MTDITEETQSGKLPRRLVNVRIEGLFGNLTHSIPLDSDSGIIILTGPNGCGKTTMLKLIEAMSNNDFRVLLEVPFQELVFRFDDATELSVIKREGNNVLEGRVSDTDLPGHLSYTGAKKRSKPTRNMVFKKECELEFVVRGSDGTELEESYISPVIEPGLDQEHFAHIMWGEERLCFPEWFSEYQGSISVQFISTERLEEQILYDTPQTFRQVEDGENDKRELAIEQFSRMLIGRVANARLAPALNKKGIEKIELFQEIINSRLVNKRLTINPLKGFEIISFMNDEILHLHKLSSGEQHIIVVFFTLIFLAQSGVLVIIDEPELSLHIAWQLKFIDDIEKVRQLSGCRFIVATHSPAIIDDHWDYVVELEV